MVIVEYANSETYADHLICSVTSKTVDLTKDGFNIDGLP
jgi:hypothetical protein